jgi:cobalt-zinc-cadmium efflux system protein
MLSVMGHGHHHGAGANAHAHHHHGAGTGPSGQRRMMGTLVLTLTYMAAEVVGGLYSGSLALLADAGHMMSDAAALALALFAMVVARRPPDDKRTYGYARTEILAAMINGAALLAIATFIVYEAYQRLSEPPEVNGPVAMAVAAGGLLINLGALGLLHGARDESLNTRGAWLHILSDTFGSVGALASGTVIWLYGWRWADPVASMLIAVLVAHAAWSLLRDTTAVLMEGAPDHVDVTAVQDAVQDLEDVSSVHDLHVWTINAGLVLCSVHVVTESATSDMLGRVNDLLRERFDIQHVTVQVEDATYAARHCAGCGLTESA